MVSSPLVEEEVDPVGLQSPLKKRCRIEILGRSYTLRGDTDEVYAKELAAIVEHKMRKLAAHTKGVDFSRLAVFTALNLADELCLLKKQQDAHDIFLRQRTGEMIASLEGQLEMGP